MIEIKGIGLPNRGAELMLVAILTEFQRRKLKTRFVVEPYGDYEERLKYSLYQKSRYFSRGINFGGILSFIPSRIRDRFGIKNRSEVSCVFDASGFVYGDKWGHRVANKRLGYEIKAFNHQRVPVIMLPQAYGPFEHPTTRNVCKKIVENANLVFARDQISFEYLKLISPNTEIDIAPDFTCLLEPSLDEDYAFLRDRVCIIPNFQMLSLRNTPKDYVEVLASVVRKLVEKNENPYILIHEGERDVKIAHDLKSKVKLDIDIVDPKDALRIKGIIGSASFVISSRFHGLVSALSSGVPVIAMGWSHKYNELLNDYGVGHLLADVDDNAILEKFSRVTDDAIYYQEIQKTIKHFAAIQKIKTEQMWDKVFKVLSDKGTNLNQ